MTAKTSSRINPAINPVLDEIISPMRQPALRRISMLETRFQFLLIGMAVGAKRRSVTGTAYLVSLCSIEAVPLEEATTMIEYPDRF
jgi:hypothetical protein